MLRERPQKTSAPCDKGSGEGRIKFVGTMEECLNCDRDVQWMGWAMLKDLG